MSQPLRSVFKKEMASYLCCGQGFLMQVSFIGWVAAVLVTNRICVFVDANMDTDNSEQEHSSLSISR